MINHTNIEFHDDRLKEIKDILDKLAPHEHADGMNECHICDQGLDEAILIELRKLAPPLSAQVEGQTKALDGKEADVNASIAPTTELSHMELNHEQIEILDHTMHRAAGGLYCGGGKDMDALVAAGLMEYAGRKSFVPDPYYRVTGAGLEALKAAKVKP